MKPGDHVVLIADDWSPRFLSRYTVPKRGTVYTIREVFDDPRTRRTGRKYLRLEEIVNPAVKHEAGFAIRRFRRLPKLTIDQFTKVTEDA